MQMDKALLSEPERIKCTNLNLYAEFGYLSHECFSNFLNFSSWKNFLGFLCTRLFGTKNKLRRK